MATPLSLAQTLKQYFLSKSGNNTIGGHIFVDTASTYDIGSPSAPLHAVYADNLIGGGGGGFGTTVKVQAGDTADYLDPKITVGSKLVKTITGTTNQAINLDVNTSTFLLRDGTNSLTGNLAVANGITIDGTDISEHVLDPDAHHARATGGTAITVAGQTVSVKLSATSALAIDGTDGGLKLGTPVSSGATSTNQLTGGGHTHTVIAYYNAAAHFNELVKFGTSGEISPAFVITPLIITDVGQSLFLQPADSIILNPTGLLIRMMSGRSFRTDTFVSGFAGSGFNFDQDVLRAGKTTGELDDLTVRGRLRVYELLIERIRATNGSVFVSSTGKAKTVTSLGGLNYRIVTDPEHGFLENDVIRAQKWTGTEIYQSDLTVTSVIDLSTFNATLSSGSTVPAKDMEYVRLGNTTDTTRQGALYLTADDSGAPFMDVVNNITSHASWNTTGKVKVRLGKLTGITGSTNEYGMIAGNNGFGINDTYIRVSNLAFELHNTPIKLYNSAVQTVNISATGTDIWVGPSSSDKRISWNGATLSIDGVLVLEGNSFLNGVVTISASGELRQGSGTFGSNFTGVRIWNQSNVGRIGGYKSNALQWYGDTDGILRAGQGNVQLGYYGMDLVAYQGSDPNPTDNVQAIAFWDTLNSVDGVNRPSARIWGASNAGNGQYGLQFEAFYSTLSTNYPKMWLIYDQLVAQRNFTLTDLDLIVLSGTTISLTGNVMVSGTTTLNNHLVVGTGSAYDFGTSGAHIRNLYVDNLIATAVIGGTALSGQTWQYDTSDMFIQSNSSSARTLFISNPGTGLMHLSVEGNISVGGTVDGTDISAHVSNVNAHHNQAHVLATTAALGSDHTVTGLTAGMVLRASGATTAYFKQLLHSELGTIGANDHHNQSHVLATTAGLGADHTVSGLTTGFVLRATSATTATFSQVQFSEIGATTGDILSQYVHISIARTITAQHTFAPVSAMPPFIIGAFGQGQTVGGLKADQLNKTVTATGGLTGGGALTGNISISVDTTIAFNWSASHTWSSGNINVVSGNYQINGTNVISSTRRILAANGAVTSPAFSFSGDTNTGIWSSGADTLGMVTGGTEWLTLSSTGLLTVNDNSDTIHKFGKFHVGNVFGGSGYAGFAHRAMVGSTTYGVIQGVVGDTYVNSASGQMVSIRVANVDVVQFAATRANPRSSNLIALGDYNRKYSEINVVQLVVDNLVASNVMATIGGRIMVAPTAKLTRDILSTDTTIYLDTNSYPLLSVIYASGLKGGIPQSERMRLINGPVAISATEWSYEVIRNVSDNGTLPINGTFAVDTSGWTNAGSVLYTLTRDTTTYFSSPASMNCALSGGVGIPLLQTVAIAVQPNTSYAVTFYARTALSSPMFSDVLQYQGASLTSDGTDITIPASANWWRYRHEFTTLATTDTIYLRFFHVPSAAYSGNFWLDDVIIEKKNTATGYNWYIGDAAVNIGYYSGSGYIDLTSTTTIAGHQGPAIAIYARPSNGGAVKPVVVNGNLRSFVDYTTDMFGIGLGNDMTLTPSGGFIGLTNDVINGIRLFNTSLSIYQSSVKILGIDTTTGLSIWNTAGIKTVVLGNLFGNVDYGSAGYGIGFGNNLALTPTTGFQGITSDAINGVRIFNVRQSMYVSGVETIRIDVQGIGLSDSAGALTATNSIVWYNGSISSNIIASNAVGYLTGYGSLGAYWMVLQAQGGASNVSKVAISARNMAGIDYNHIVVTGHNPGIGTIGSVQISSDGDGVAIMHSAGSSGIVVNGNGTLIGSGLGSTSGLYLTNSFWHGIAANNFAEICNDLSTFRQLMIVGNTFGGTSYRKVGLWDRVQIGGVTTFLNTLQIAGDMYMANMGAVPSTPSAGGVLYVVSGALWFKGSSGTATKIANA